MASDEELVQSNLEYYRTNAEALFWAWEEVNRLVEGEPERAWYIVAAIIRASPDERTRLAVAAGPLEDLLHFHGTALWPRIHVDARREPVLRDTLRGVWRSGMPQDVWDSLQAFLAPVPAASKRRK